jgi:hypothetical protein
VQYGLGYLSLYVAHDAGMFEKHMKTQGLEPVPVRIGNFTGKPKIEDRLPSQSLNVGAVLLSTRDKRGGTGDREELGLHIPPYPTPCSARSSGRPAIGKMASSRSGMPRMATEQIFVHVDTRRVPRRLAASEESTQMLCKVPQRGGTIEVVP